MKYFNTSISLSKEGMEILKDSNIINYILVFRELVNLAIALDDKIECWMYSISMTIWPNSRAEELTEIYILSQKILALGKRLEERKLKDIVEDKI